MLNPYLVTTPEPQEGAFLTFHSTRRKAMVLAWQQSSELRELCDDDYTWIRAWRLPSVPHLMDQATSAEPHVIVSPAICPSCEMWGANPPTKGGCEGCEGDEWA